MSKISAGVPTIRKNGGTSRGPATITANETSIVIVTVVPTVLESSWRRLAPKYWAVITPAPVEMPTKSTSSRLIIGPLAPTAAKALSPTYWPTTMESTVL